MALLKQKGELEALVRWARLVFHAIGAMDSGKPVFSTASSLMLGSRSFLACIVTAVIRVPANTLKKALDKPMTERGSEDVQLLRNLFARNGIEHNSPASASPFFMPATWPICDRGGKEYMDRGRFPGLTEEGLRAIELGLLGEQQSRLAEAAAQQPAPPRVFPRVHISSGSYSLSGPQLSSANASPFASPRATQAAGKQAALTMPPPFGYDTCQAAADAADSVMLDTPVINSSSAALLQRIKAAVDAVTREDTEEGEKEAAAAAVDSVTLDMPRIIASNTVAFHCTKETLEAGFADKMKKAAEKKKAAEDKAEAEAAAQAKADEDRRLQAQCERLNQEAVFVLEEEERVRAEEDANIDAELDMIMATAESAQPPGPSGLPSSQDLPAASQPSTPMPPLEKGSAPPSPASESSVTDISETESEPGQLEPARASTHQNQSSQSAPSSQPQFRGPHAGLGMPPLPTSKPANQSATEVVQPQASKLKTKTCNTLHVPNIKAPKSRLPVLKSVHKRQFVIDSRGNHVEVMPSGRCVGVTQAEFEAANTQTSSNQGPTKQSSFKSTPRGSIKDNTRPKAKTQTGVRSRSKPGNLTNIQTLPPASKATATTSSAPRPPKSTTTPVTAAAVQAPSVSNQSAGQTLEQVLDQVVAKSQADLDKGLNRVNDANEALAKLKHRALAQSAAQAHLNMPPTVAVSRQPQAAASAGQFHSSAGFRPGTNATMTSSSSSASSSAAPSGYTHVVQPRLPVLLLSLPRGFEWACSEMQPDYFEDSFCGFCSKPVLQSPHVHQHTARVQSSGPYVDKCRRLICDSCINLHVSLPVPQLSQKRCACGAAACFNDGRMSVEKVSRLAEEALGSLRLKCIQCADTCEVRNVSVHVCDGRHTCPSCGCRVGPAEGGLFAHVFVCRISSIKESFPKEWERNVQLADPKNGCL